MKYAIREKERGEREGQGYADAYQSATATVEVPWEDRKEGSGKAKARAEMRRREMSRVPMHAANIDSVPKGNREKAEEPDVGAGETMGESQTMTPEETEKKKFERERREERKEAEKGEQKGRACRGSSRPPSPSSLRSTA